MQALEGVTILDFSHLLQGPFATQLLGDLGANIIKVERAGSGDLFRSMTFCNRWLGGRESPSFLAWNRNKRSIALDLKAEQARAVVERMIPQVDVVVQNFRPGVMDRMGYGYEALAAINPRLIYCSGSGYGEHGPYLTRPGQDMLIQGLTGLAWNTGPADQRPIPIGAGFADQIGAFNMVYGILAALYARERSGRGQKIEVNLMACLLAHQAQEFVSVLASGQDFERPASGIGHPGMDAPFGIYRTADGFVSIAMSPFARLVDALEAPYLLAYDDPEILFTRRDEVFDAIEARTLTYTTATLMERLLERDVWAAEVRRMSEVPDDPQVRHLGMFTDIDHPVAGRYSVPAPTVSLSDTPAEISRRPPMIGEHSREILAEFGFSGAEIDTLAQAGVFTEEAAPESAGEAGA